MPGDTIGKAERDSETVGLLNCATALDCVNDVDPAILTKEGAVNLPSPGVCVPGALTIAVALATAVRKPEAEETRAT